MNSTRIRQHTDFHRLQLRTSWISQGHRCIFIPIQVPSWLVSSQFQSVLYFPRHCEAHSDAAIHAEAAKST
ncbi:hypothetical protein EST62_12450, partial [Chlorobaculum sp. 24CR]